MRTLFVYEHVSAGGVPGASRDLRRQGRAMLDAVVRDVARSGRRRVVTLLRPGARVPAGWRGVEVVRAAPGALAAAFDAAAWRADEAWVIAPETDGALADRSERAAACGARLLGATPDAVRAVADKLTLAARLAAAGLRVPPTFGVREEPGAGAWALVADAAGSGAGARGEARVALGCGARDWETPPFAASGDLPRFPLIVKPSPGAGCEGVWLVRTRTELARAARAARRAGAARVVVQPYVRGVPASALLLCAGDGRAVPLSLNGQRVVPGRPFRYRGGVVPMRCPAAEAALEAACRACALWPGLRGIVGVDLVLADDGPWVIEVNPRVTMSYLALRAVAPENPADWVLDLAEEGKLPRPPVLCGVARFSAAGAVRVTGDEAVPGPRR